MSADKFSFKSSVNFFLSVVVLGSLFASNDAQAFGENPPIIHFTYLEDEKWNPQDVFILLPAPKTKYGIFRSSQGMHGALLQYGLLTGVDGVQLSGVDDVKLTAVAVEINACTIKPQTQTCERRLVIYWQQFDLANPLRPATAMPMIRSQYLLDESEFQEFLRAYIMWRRFGNFEPKDEAKVQKLNMHLAWGRKGETSKNFFLFKSILVQFVGLNNLMKVEVVKQAAPIWIKNQLVVTASMQKQAERNAHQLNWENQQKR